MSSPNKMYQLIKHILGYVDDKGQYSNDWNDERESMVHGVLCAWLICARFHSIRHALIDAGSLIIFH